jgi:exopolysaccharide biosynthesis predicted pyruvyltransferase EpsI
VDQFEKILSDHRADRIVVMSPIATFGDDLLQIGLLKKLRELRINFFVMQYVPEKARSRQIRKIMKRFYVPKLASERSEKIVTSLLNRLSLKELSRVKDCDTVLVRGGGYLNDIWGDYDVLRSAMQIDANSIILAPQSTCLNVATLKNLLNSITKELHVFCREKYTYKVLNTIGLKNSIHLYLAPDTALYLSKNDLLLGTNPRHNAGEYDLFCTRVDEENFVKWERNKIKEYLFSSSQNGKSQRALVGDVDRISDFESWKSLICGAHKVFTDRLHVGIFSAILGKETYLYPNSYFKNKGVYEYSLRKFPNVKFVNSSVFDEKQIL